MTIQKCQAILSEIRRRQGTDHPVLQVKLANGVVRGRLSRADTDCPQMRNPQSPFGVIELEQLGLGREATTLVQIASIPEDGLADPLAN